MATAEKNTAFWMNPHERTYGECSAEDERIHRESNAEHAEDMSAVETKYIGFSVPGANIHSMNYMMLHPSLGVASGGAWAWQGYKPSQLHSEIFDMRDFMPIDIVGELDRYELPSGFSYEVIKPLEQVRVSFDDPLRNNAFDVTLTGTMPPAMLPSGKHFDQAMRTRGSITLDGQRFAVDGFTMRTRSWGEICPQGPVVTPPIHFLHMQFDEDFAIHVMAMEDPEHDPLWLGSADFTADQVNAFNRGWVWRNGELTALTSVSLRTKWNRANGYPAAQRIEIVDTNDKRYSVTGEITGGSRWYSWSNGCFPTCLTRWECQGRVGWGDTQIGIWENFARKLDA